MEVGQWRKWLIQKGKIEEWQGLGCREDECSGEYGYSCEQARSGLWAMVEVVRV